MASKVVVDEEDKIIEFLTLILFHCLRFGDIKIPIEIKNQYIVLILYSSLDVIKSPVNDLFSLPLPGWQLSTIN